MGQFTRVDLATETDIHFAEHEILMSFYDDEGCEAFQQWWNEEGSILFNNWLEINDYDEFKKLAE